MLVSVLTIIQKLIASKEKLFYKIKNHSKHLLRQHLTFLNNV